MHTISACYPEKEVDEKPFMDSVVAATGAVPLFVYPKAEDVFSAAERITWHQDEPYGSTSIFAQWSVFAAARSSGVKVMLDGQGADEQLAGYHGAFFYRMDELIRERRWDVEVYQELLDATNYAIGGAATCARPWPENPDWRAWENLQLLIREATRIAAELCRRRDEREGR